MQKGYFQTKCSSWGSVSNISASDIRDEQLARYRFRFDYYLPLPRNPWGAKGSGWMVANAEK